MRLIVAAANEKTLAGSENSWPFTTAHQTANGERGETATLQTAQWQLVASYKSRRPQHEKPKLAAAESADVPTTGSWEPVPAGVTQVSFEAETQIGDWQLSVPMRTVMFDCSGSEKSK